MFLQELILFLFITREALKRVLSEILFQCIDFNQKGRCTSISNIKFKYKISLLENALVFELLNIRHPHAHTKIHTSDPRDENS